METTIYDSEKKNKEGKIKSFEWFKKGVKECDC